MAMALTEIPRYPGKVPPGMGRNCDLDITLYHLTHWIHYERDENHLFIYLNSWPWQDELHTCEERLDVSWHDISSVSV